MSKKIYLKNPIRLFLAFVAVAAMSILFMLLFTSPVEGDNIPEYSMIMVSKGDTLWNIAKQYTNENQDVRDKVAEIKELNDINSTIQAGQTLKIRIK